MDFMQFIAELDMDQAHVLAWANAQVAASRACDVQLSRFGDPEGKRFKQHARCDASPLAQSWTPVLLIVCHVYVLWMRVCQCVYTRCVYVICAGMGAARRHFPRPYSTVKKISDSDHRSQISALVGSSRSLSLYIHIYIIRGATVFVLSHRTPPCLPAHRLGERDARLHASLPLHVLHLHATTGHLYGELWWGYEIVKPPR
jgi:hypothetical protein